MSYFVISNAPLKGTMLWQAMLCHCANDKNNGAVLPQAIRDRRTGKGHTSIVFEIQTVQEKGLLFVVEDWTKGRAF